MGNKKESPTPAANTKLRLIIRAVWREDGNIAGGTTNLGTSGGARTIWQDIVMTACNIAFTYAMVTQVVCGFRRKAGGITYPTGIVFGLGSWAIAVCSYTLGLLFFAITCAILGALWLCSVVQRAIYGR